MVTKFTWFSFLIILLGVVSPFWSNALVISPEWPLPEWSTDFIATHDFHISKTRLEYVAAQSEWQLSLHLFIDDLEVALTADTDERLYLGTEREVARTDSLIQQYLTAKIELIADGQKLQLAWLGKETTEDLSAFWVYLYVPAVETPQVLSISNRILLELHDDQQNIVQVIGPGTDSKHLLFHRDYLRENIRF